MPKVDKPARPSQQSTASTSNDQTRTAPRGKLDAVAPSADDRRERRPQGPIERFIARRVERAMIPRKPNPTVLRLQKPFWDWLCDHYFRLEIEGWHRIPDPPCLLIGIHSGGSLTMDAWTLVYSWWRHFGDERPLHGTAHDVLMATPGLGDYFKAMGVIPASRKSVSAALEAGHDVIVWPGGEEDAMRSWRKRDVAVLAGRKGFVRQAIRSKMPIVPVATVGGHDTVFILSEGRTLARRLPFGLGKKLRSANLPIISGFPFPLAVETVPTHLPLPAKIRTEFLDPIRVDTDPKCLEDEAYIDSIYRQVETAIQEGMNRLAAQRSFPIMG